MASNFQEIQRRTAMSLDDIIKEGKKGGKRRQKPKTSNDFDQVMQETPPPKQRQVSFVNREAMLFMCVPIIENIEESTTTLENTFTETGYDASNGC
jgi:hypothetical protein